MGYWENNKSFLRRELTKILEDKKDCGKCRLQRAENGSQMIVIEHDGNEYVLNNVLSPDIILKDIAGKEGEIEDYTVIFLFGISDGLVAKELLGAMNETNNLIIYEPSIDVLKLVMQNFDYSDLLMDERVSLIDTIENNQSLIDCIKEKINLYNGELSKLCCQPDYELLFEKEYAFLLGQIQYQIRLEKINVNTIMLYEEKYIDTSMRNLVSSIYAKDIVALKNSLNENVDFDHIPAIIVAAGPSLDKNVDLLKQAKGKAFILSVDAALRALDKHGICPDAFFSIDVKVPKAFYKDIGIDEIPLFFIDHTKAELVYCHKEINIVAKAPMQIYQDYYHETVKQDFPELETSGAVGTDAMVLVQYLGFKNIIFIGLDLAYKGNQTHSKDMNAQETKYKTLLCDKIKVPGVDGYDVETNIQFDFYRKWLEARLINNPECNVIDATEGGALIKGAKLLPLQAAIDTYCKKEVDFKRLFRELPASFNTKEQEELMQFIKGKMSVIEDLERKVKRALEVYPKLIELASNGQEETAEFARLYYEVRDIDSLDSDNEFAEQLKIYNRKKNYDNVEAVYDKDTTMVQLLQHALNIIEGYRDSLVQLKRDYKEKVIERL